MKKPYRWYADPDWWIGFVTGWIVIHVIEFLAKRL